LQELMGYTAQLSGLALSPGGAVIMCMMPVVGLLVSKVDTRILITFGCLVSSIALFVMAGWDLGLDYGHAVRARMLQSFGLAFLFIPINVAAFAYVPREKTNMGTGIINLARNIGASVGIATVTTMLQRRAQVHQVRLAEHVNELSAAYHNMINGTQVRLVSAGSGMAQASAQAQGMIYSTVQRQSAMLAFIDNFKMLGVVFLAVIPVLMLLKKPKTPAGNVPVH
jgi:DHA2 family multidrug resistance protein